MTIDIAILKSRLTLSVILRAHGHEPTNNRMPCPIHQGGNRSSFSIRTGDTYARCWACGWHGDVIALEQALGGGTAAEAIKRCAGMAGLAPAPKLHRETARRLQAEADLERQAAQAEHRRQQEEWRWWALRVPELDRALRQLTTLRLDARLQGKTEAEEQALDLIAELTQRRELAERMAEEWRLCLARP